MNQQENREKVVDMGTIGEGGCPCGEVKGYGYTIKAHCWRVRNCCPFSGVHYQSTAKQKKKAKAHSKEVAKNIKEWWRTDCKVKSTKML